MNIYNILDISLFQIKLFLSAAKHLNFTKAAEEQNVTQSMISKNIKTMENLLGIPLFERKKTGLTLTVSGKYLCETFSGLISGVDEAVQHAQRLQEEQDLTVTIGLPDSVDPEGYLNETIDYVKSKCPLNIIVELMPYQVIKERLLTEEIDLCFTFLFEKEDYENSGLEVTEIVQCPLSAYMHCSNPLSGKEKIIMEDLKNQHFVSIAPSHARDYSKLLNTLCNDAGFTPQIASYLKSSISMAMNINENNKIFIADSYVNNKNPEIIEVELETRYNSGAIMVHPKEVSSQAKDFIRAAKEYWQV